MNEPLVDECIVAIVAALQSVPAMTHNQLQRWLPHDFDMDAVLAQLIRRGLIRAAQFMVRTVDISDGPLAVFPGADRANDAKALAGRVRKRYGLPRKTVVYSLGELRRPLQIDHEIGVAEVYLWYAANRPEWSWTPETPRRGALVPDATVIAPDGRRIAIDFIAEYRRPKLESIAASGVDYELW